MLISMESSSGAHCGGSLDPTSDGVILWRFATRGRNDLWGMVFEMPDGFYFVVDDDPEGPRPYLLHERYHDIAGLMDRVEAVSGSLRRCGWTEIDVE
jgi:hypothetical protein